MKIALKFPALALVVALAATASATLSTPTYHHHHDAATSVASDPDPADCPFCGGNPAVHVRRLQDLERTSMALYARLLR